VEDINQETFLFRSNNSIKTVIKWKIFGVKGFSKLRVSERENGMKASSSAIN